MIIGSKPVAIERVQTGVRIERRLLKVMKAVAELHDVSLGNLIEGLALHAFEGKLPFLPEALARITQIKSVYGLDIDASASHHLQESADDRR